MSEFLGNVVFLNYDCDVYAAQYQAGGVAIQLLDRESRDLVATATSWIEGLAPDEVAIKDYSVNTGMYQTLVDAGIITPVHREVVSGFVVFPICRLSS
jgi:hypothetical protein